MSTSGPTTRSVPLLRVLFNSDAFKNARFAKIKSPVEAVVGTTRLVEDFKAPKPGVPALVAEMRYMGQDLANPLTVEGLAYGPGVDRQRHSGRAHQLHRRPVGNIKLPGIRAIIERLSAEGPTISPERLVDSCLELLGHYELAEDTHKMLVEHAQRGGELRTGTEDFAQRVGNASAHRIDPRISLCLRGAKHGYEYQR